VQSVAAPGGPPDSQRLTYAVLRRLEDGTSYSALFHNQLKRVKRTARATPPFYARHELVLNDQQLRKHWQAMNVRVEEIAQHRAWLDWGVVSLDSPRIDASPSKDCSWACPFYHLCPMMDDGSDWEWYLGEEFVEGESHVPGREDDDV